MDLLQSNIYLSTIMVALSCSTTCNQVPVFFLGSWITGSKSTAKKGFLSVVYFLLGKAFIYISFSLIASFIGEKVENILKTKFVKSSTILFSLFLIGFGIYCVANFFIKKKCSSCSSCKKPKQSFEVTPLKALLAGLAYGVTPCFPMTVLLVNASMVSTLKALILGVLFSATSFITPLLIIGAVSGKLSQMMRRDISPCIKYFQLVFSLCFIILGALNFYNAIQ